MDRTDSHLPHLQRMRVRALVSSIVTAGRVGKPHRRVRRAGLGPRARCMAARDFGFWFRNGLTYESPLSCPRAMLEAHPTGGAMPRTWRLASPVVVTALLMVVASFPLRAIGPAILM